MNFYPKSFILVRFSAPKLKISLNHGDVLNELLQKIFYFGAFQVPKVLNELLPKILHSGALQIS